MQADSDEPEGSPQSKVSLWPALSTGGLVIAGALAFSLHLRDREERALEAATSSAQQAIGWVDPDLRVRWIVPLAGNEAAVGLDLGFEARRREALQKSRDERASHISRPIQLVQGGLGMNGYVPLHLDGRFEGFVGFVWRARDLFSYLLGNVAPGFGVRISDDSELLYERDAHDALWSLARAGVSHEPTGRPWSVEVAPLPDLVSTHRTLLPAFVAVGGSAYGLAFAFTLYLALARRSQNRRLLAEVNRREVIEDDLSRVLEAIPDDVWRIEVTRDGIATLYYSEKVARIAGGTLERFASSLETWYERVHPEDVARIKRLYLELTSGQRDTVDFEYRIFAADGSVVWLHERAKGTPSPRGFYIDGTTSNITEAKRVELERRRREKQDLLAAERARMMREMHDGLGGQLVSTIALVESGKGTPREVQEALRRALDDMRVLLDAFDAETPDLTSTLGKLRARLDPLLRRNGLALHWRVEEVAGIDGFPPEQTLHFLRIIQEAVTNALRHANASEVSVRVCAEDPDGDRLRVEISDDGCGLQADTTTHGRGLANMKSRAAALGAELRFVRLDPGTRVELLVPLQRQ